MDGWEILAWFLVAMVAVFRVALAVGILVLVVIIIRALRAMPPASTTH